MTTPRRRGSLREVAANWRASPLPVLKRLGVAVRNLVRRFGPPPRDCCGHPGEPGC
ncbi:MAG: hypothetical protein NZ951_02565 [Dehalococcoidia bacterium]|nr:hypothetical protein [Dehalococcoidia bacterium]MDW8119843.1 hypothetical protein [Chloroflexota bacterium]